MNDDGPNQNEPETNRKEKPLTARQERVAAALAAGRVQAAVCRDFHVAASTLWTWKKNPAFVERVEALRKDANDAVLARLTAIMGGKALDVLECKLDARDDKGQPTATLADIKAAFELRGNITNDELMEMLEQILENQKGQR